MVTTPDFIQIPAPVLAAKIPASHKILFGYIYWYTKLALQTCTASNESLGRLAGLDAGTVSDAIRGLRELGFISVSYDGSPQSKNTVRTIDSLLSYKKHVPSNQGTSLRSYVPSNQGTGALENRTKEEKIKRNRKDIEIENGGKAVEKDHRGEYSPALERLRTKYGNGVTNKTKVRG